LISNANGSELAVANWRMLLSNVNIVGFEINLLFEQPYSCGLQSIFQNEQTLKMEVLEARQQNILLQLKQLKEQLLAMHGNIAAPVQDGKKSDQKAQKQNRSKTQGNPIDVS
jgi:hypothetical protein